MDVLERSIWVRRNFPSALGRGGIQLNCNDEVYIYGKHKIWGNMLNAATRELMELDTDEMNNKFTPNDIEIIHSCMTLFYLISDDNIFYHVIEKHFDYHLHPETVNIVGRWNAGRDWNDAE